MAGVSATRVVKFLLVISQVTTQPIPTNKKHEAGKT